jgi:hypothetical protein
VTEHSGSRRNGSGFQIYAYNHETMFAVILAPTTPTYMCIVHGLQFMVMLDPTMHADMFIVMYFA